MVPVKDDSLKHLTHKNEFLARAKWQPGVIHSFEMFREMERSEEKGSDMESDRARQRGGEEWEERRRERIIESGKKKKKNVIGGTNETNELEEILFSFKVGNSWSHSVLASHHDAHIQDPFTCRRFQTNHCILPLHLLGSNSPCLFVVLSNKISSTYVWNQKAFRNKWL